MPIKATSHHKDRKVNRVEKHHNTAQQSAAEYEPTTFSEYVALISAAIILGAMAFMWWCPPGIVRPQTRLNAHFGQDFASSSFKPPEQMHFHKESSHRIVADSGAKRISDEEESEADTMAFLERMRAETAKRASEETHKNTQQPKIQATVKSKRRALDDSFVFRHHPQVKHGMVNISSQYPNVYHAYLDGATIVCNLVSAYWQPIAGLMDGILQETGLAYMANMYLTPRNSQGFIEHTDNKDGLILQTAGRKEWSLKDTSFPMPLRHQMVGRPQEKPSASVAGDVVLTPILTPGDVLFVPRGMPHYAKSVADHPSLHFTVSPTKNLEWVDFYLSLLSVSRGFVAARTNALLGEDTSSTEEMLSCINALADAHLTAIRNAAEDPAQYELRRSLPWWYRALAGVTVPAVHSAIGYTANQCRDRLPSNEASPEKVMQIKLLTDKLSKGVTLPKILELFSLCRPETQAIPIKGVHECQKISQLLEAENIRFLDNMIADIMEDQELFQAILPNVMKRNSVFIDYTQRLQQKGLKEDIDQYRHVSLSPSTVLKFTTYDWSFTHNDSQLTIITADKQVQFRFTSQLERELTALKQWATTSAEFTLDALAHVVEPSDEFEAACLARIFAELGILERAQTLLDGVPEEYAHLTANRMGETVQPPPLPEPPGAAETETSKPSKTSSVSHE